MFVRAHNLLRPPPPPHGNPGSAPGRWINLLHGIGVATVHLGGMHGRQPFAARRKSLLVLQECCTYEACINSVVCSMHGLCLKLQFCVCIHVCYVALFWLRVKFDIFLSWECDGLTKIMFQLLNKIVTYNVILFGNPRFVNVHWTWL